MHIPNYTNKLLTLKTNTYFVAIAFTFINELTLKNDLVSSIKYLGTKQKGTFLVVFRETESSALFSHEPLKTQKILCIYINSRKIENVQYIRI